MGKRKFGGLWISLPASEVSRIERILDFGSGSFTKAVPVSILSEGDSSLALLSKLPGEVNYIALVTAGSRNSDIERKVQIGPVIVLNKTLSTSNLIDSIPPRLKYHARLLHNSITPIPPATWDHLFKKTISLSKISRHEIEKLLELMNSRSPQSRDSLSEIISFERDAIAIALDVFGGSTLRRNIISNSAAVDNAPFINRLKHNYVRQIEDQMISHDAINFPGLQSLRPRYGRCSPASTRRWNSNCFKCQ